MERVRVPEPELAAEARAALRVEELARTQTWKDTRHDRRDATVIHSTMREPMHTRRGKPSPPPHSFRLLRPHSMARKWAPYSMRRFRC